MIYASIGIIALLVQLIINYDVLMNKTSEETARRNKPYRRFLFGTLFYYTTDILWGYFDEKGYQGLLYADTELYFLAMSLMVMLWTNYATDYLEHKTGFGKMLKAAGQIFFAFSPIALLINLFTSFLFNINKQGEYAPTIIRYLLLTFQILLFSLTALHTFILSRKVSEVKRVRYRAISVFGLVMSTLIFVQVYNPLLPLYSVGCMLGTCLLHTFIYEDEKAEYRKELEKLLRQEMESRQQLNFVTAAANTDPLTGVKSRRAYIEMVVNTS